MKQKITKTPILKKETIQILNDDSRNIFGGNPNGSSIVIVSAITKDIPTAGDITCKDYPTVSVEV